MPKRCGHCRCLSTWLDPNQTFRLKARLVLERGRGETKARLVLGTPSEGVPRWQKGPSRAAKSYTPRLTVAKTGCGGPTLSRFKGMSSQALSYLRDRHPDSLACTSRTSPRESGTSAPWLGLEDFARLSMLTANGKTPNDPKDGWERGRNQNASWRKKKKALRELLLSILTLAKLSLILIYSIFNLSPPASRPRGEGGR